jgi:hypothetical protein
MGARLSSTLLLAVLGCAQEDAFLRIVIRNKLQTTSAARRKIVDESYHFVRGVWGLVVRASRFELSCFYAPVMLFTNGRVSYS